MYTLPDSWLFPFQTKDAVTFPRFLAGGWNAVQTANARAVHGAIGQAFTVWIEKTQTPHDRDFFAEILRRTADQVKKKP